MIVCPTCEKLFTPSKYRIGVYCSIPCHKERLFDKARFLGAFFEKVNKRGTGGCWLWTGALDSRGRGALTWRGKRQAAHRVAWELLKGPIKNGLWVLHHCDVRNCCNPKHLYLGDVKDNARDMVERGRHRHRYTKKGDLLFPHLSKRFANRGAEISTQDKQEK